MSDPLYRRIVSPSGRVRYEEAGVHDADCYPVGAHLVVVVPGLRTTRYHVEPAYAALLAATVPAREAMLAAIREAGTLRPEVDDETHRRAWEAYLAAGGPAGGIPLRGASPREIVDAAIEALVRAAGGVK